MCELHDIFYLGCRHWGANPEVRHVCSAAKVRSYYQHYGCHDREVVGCMSVPGQCRSCARYKGVSWQKPQQHSFTSSPPRSSPMSRNNSNSNSISISNGTGDGKIGTNNLVGSTFSARVSVSTGASTNFMHVEPCKRGSIMSLGSLDSNRTTLCGSDVWGSAGVGDCQCANFGDKCGDGLAKDGNGGRVVDEGDGKYDEEDEERTVAEAAEAKARAAVGTLRSLMPWMSEGTMRRLFVAGTGGSCTASTTSNGGKGGIDSKKTEENSKS